VGRHKRQFFRKVKMIFLGIETSCDDTSLCLLEGDPDRLEEAPKVIGLRLFSQETLLEKWGGVVPEIAARNHLAKIGPLLNELFKETNKSPSDIDAIGVTTHPGLLGPLLTGLNTAKSLSLVYKLPLIPVNHLYAHIEAIHLTESIPYPYLGMVVSGGHSMFLLVKSPLDFELLGTTIDDAAGEAFDKGGKVLQLGYPAGKIIDQLAKDGDAYKYSFPIGLKQSANADLSYSGVKTSLRQFIEKNNLPSSDSSEMRDICASYQEAIVQALKLKARYALKKARQLTNGSLPIVIGGGVACNSRLREVFQTTYKDVHIVSPMYCTDNGAMIANYALRSFHQNKINHPDSLWIDAKSRVVDKNALQEKAKGHI
jgi:N6-L-threonylcarbamoyladenine synthase